MALVTFAKNTRGYKDWLSSQSCASTVFVKSLTMYGACSSKRVINLFTSTALPFSDAPTIIAIFLGEKPILFSAGYPQLIKASRGRSTIANKAYQLNTARVHL